MRIVIIGNGVAGVEAAMTVRARDPRAQVTVVSEESHHFFSRTALMYVLSGQLSHRCIEPHERDLYARHGLQRVRARALGVDVEAKTVRLAGGLAPLPYDRLLIAAGSRPRPAPWPGADLAGVGHFVTLQDLEWLERELHGGPGRMGRPPEADAHLLASADGSPYAPRPVARQLRGRAPAHAVVIGGGLVGIEVVEVLIAAGLRPSFVVRDEWFWPMSLDAREAGFVTERLREHGVDVRLREHVCALSGDGLIAEVTTDAGSLPCELCVVAIGVVPNTGWLEGSAIARDESGGILVDPHLATSAPDVFAAGDCASIRGPDGRARPELLWYTARDQGRVAGQALSGERVTYARGVPYNSAKLMDVEYTTVGDARADAPSFFFEERGAVRSTTRIVLDGPRVVGFNMLGRRWDHAVFLAWIEERRSLRYVLDHLEEARFDTELVPPLVIPRATPDPLSA